MDREDKTVSVDSLTNVRFISISNHSSKILSGLKELRNDPTFADAVLCAGSNEYPCHRAVLASSSPYFRAMFSTPLRESHDNRVSFNEMSNAALAQIINFIYTGQAEINYENAQDLLAAANLLQFHEIVEACCDFLKSHLHSTNCLGIEWFSYLHSLHKLESEARQYAIENFDGVIESDEFLQLSSERLCRYLACSNIDICSEEKLYEAAIRWSEEVQCPDDVLCRIFSFIRFNFMPPTYLCDVVSKGRHFQKCDCCLSLIKLPGHNGNLLIENCPGGATQDLEGVTPRPSTLAKEVIVILGTDDVSENGVLETFDPVKERWMNLSDEKLPCSLVGIGVTTIGNDIIITGGIHGEQVLSEVWCFLSNERRWLPLPCLLEPRAYHSCTSWNGCIYVLGGMSIYTADRRYAPALETVECLDLSNFLSTVKSEADDRRQDSYVGSSWKMVARIPCPRIGSSAVTVEGAIIEVGGTQYGVAVKKLESYRCFPVPQLPPDKGRKHSMVLFGDGQLRTSTFAGGEQFVLPDVIEKSHIVILDGQLYILWEDSRRFILLNPIKRIFRDLARPCASNVGGNMAVLGNKIYFVSGRSNASIECSELIECYDTTKNTWVSRKYFDKGLSNVHCVTIKIKSIH